MGTNDKMKELKAEAYRIISQDPRGIFPEFEFIRNGKGWYSGNTRDVEGTIKSQKGKVWIYDTRPGYFYDYRTSESVSFWDYLVKVKGIQTPFPTLLEYAGLQIEQQSHKNPNEMELVGGVHPFILKKCMEIFAEELAASETGREVREYLENRGYSNNDIEQMKLGALPDLEVLREKLFKELNIDRKFIDFFIDRKMKFRDREGYIIEQYKYHPVTIPCFGMHGKIEGFSFRCVAPSSLPEGQGKYKNLKDTNKEKGVLNVPKGTEEIIIVEGLLTSLLAKAKGARNTVPLCGSSLNDDQIAAIADMGVKRIILCLDDDEAGEKATLNIVKKILRHESTIEVFTVCHDGKGNEIDEMMIEKGIDSFHNLVRFCDGMGEYLAKHLMETYPKRESDGALPSLQRRRMLEDCKVIRASLEAFSLELDDFNGCVEAYIKRSW